MFPKAKPCHNKGRLFFVLPFRQREKRRPTACRQPSRNLWLLHLILREEPLDAALGVHDLLLACVERMAGRADFHADVLAGGAGLERVAALADNTGGLIFRMDSRLHECHSPLVNKPYYYIRFQVPFQLSEPENRLSR